MILNAINSSETNGRPGQIGLLVRSGKLCLSDKVRALLYYTVLLSFLLKILRLDLTYLRSLQITSAGFDIYYCFRCDSSVVIWMDGRMDRKISVGLHGEVRTQAGWYSRNVQNVYSGGGQFDSRSAHMLDNTSHVSVLVNGKSVPWLGHDCFLSKPFQFIIRQSFYYKHCRVWDTDRDTKRVTKTVPNATTGALLQIPFPNAPKFIVRYDDITEKPAASASLRVTLITSCKIAHRWNPLALS
jgi:hypothetical protein